MRSSGGLPAASSASLELSGRRLRNLLIVVTVMAILTAGWPLLNLAVSNHQLLARGTTLTVGPNSGQSARITVGPGWSVRSSQSNPQSGYSLDHGAVNLAVTYVTLANRAQTPRLWAGLRLILEITDPGARLPLFARLTTIHGRTGLTGRLTGKALAGSAMVFAAPSGAYAVEILMLGPRTASRASRAAARQVVMSLRFAAAR
jgi:hypothetical protein